MITFKQFISEGDIEERRAAGNRIRRQFPELAKRLKLSPSNIKTLVPLGSDKKGYDAYITITPPPGKREVLGMDAIALLQKRLPEVLRAVYGEEGLRIKDITVSKHEWDYGKKHIHLMAMMEFDV